MQISFCRLRDNNDLEIIVNPRAVRYLVTAGHGMTRICFDSAHTVNVRGSPREVQRKLTDQTEISGFVEPVVVEDR